MIESTSPARILNLTMMSADSSNRPLGTWIRRRFIGVCFALLAIFHAVDVVPWGELPNDETKQFVAQTMHRVGLATGPWTMFAPNPIADNLWLSATIASETPTVSEWHSPEWGTVGAAEKFLRFRSLNYYDRISLDGYRLAAEDFADYLSRSEMSEDGVQPSVVLSTNGLKVVLPSEGGVPSRDDVIRMLHSQTIVRLDAKP